MLRALPGSDRPDRDAQARVEASRSRADGSSNSSLRSAPETRTSSPGLAAVGAPQPDAPDRRPEPHRDGTLRPVAGERQPPHVRITREDERAWLGPIRTNDLAPDPAGPSRRQPLTRAEWLECVPPATRSGRTTGIADLDADRENAAGERRKEDQPEGLILARHGRDVRLDPTEIAGPICAVRDLAGHHRRPEAKRRRRRDRHVVTLVGRVLQLVAAHPARSRGGACRPSEPMWSWPGSGHSGGHRR